MNLLLKDDNAPEQLCERDGGDFFFSGLVLYGDVAGLCVTFLVLVNFLIVHESGFSARKETFVLRLVNNECFLIGAASWS